MTSNDDYVLQLLQEEGMVTQEQIDEVYNGTKVPTLGEE